MDFLKRCNGLKIPAAPLSEAAVLVLKRALPRARDLFEAALRSGELDRHGDFHLGQRYRSLYDVQHRIESAIDKEPPIFSGDRVGGGEAEFLADPEAWALDALRDCAAADHWYTFEKDYGEVE